MEDKLRRYIDGLFARTAPTKKAIELKEEMLQNLNDKYSDLISEGKTPEAAYNIAVAGIGDVSGLLDELEPEADEYDESFIAVVETARQKNAMITAVSVMLYILSILPMVVLALTNNHNTMSIGVPVMLLLVAIATGLLIYNNMTKPRYLRNQDTMVDEFREWQSGSNNRKSLRRAISSAMWAILVALYFIISFGSSAWHLTWIVFLLGAAIEAVINIFFTIKK